MAYEFIMLATPATQQKPLEELRRTIVDWAPGLRDKQAFWKRRTSIVKVDMLLMAYFARLPVPAELRADLRYVLTKSPFFLEEMLKIANIPRVYGWPFGWLAPTVGALETLQCLSVALTPSARRPPPGGAAASASAGGGFFLDAALLALPGVDIDAAKRLARHRKIRTLTDLLLLGGAEERRLALVEAGLVDGDGSPPRRGSPPRAPWPPSRPPSWPCPTSRSRRPRRGWATSTQTTSQTPTTTATTSRARATSSPSPAARCSRAAAIPPRPTPGPRAGRCSPSRPTSPAGCR